MQPCLLQGVSSFSEETRDEEQEAAEGWRVRVAVPTASLAPGERYVLRFHGSRWPRGAFSGESSTQPWPLNANAKP